MIKVYKDYNDIPNALLSEKNVKKMRISAAGIQHEYVHQMISTQEVKEKLKSLYNNKCAFCESNAEKIYAKQFRPKQLYKWLAYEWSNLLPVCTDCYLSKKELFPVEDENNRIAKPAADRNEWIAASKTFLNEGAMILNPEIDSPEEHLTFAANGKIEGLTARGTATIECLDLNRETLTTERSNVVSLFQTRFFQKLKAVKKLFPANASINNPETENIIFQTFEPIFSELVLATDSEVEFALLGRVMLEKFESFFVNFLQKDTDKDILNKSYQLFKNEWNEFKELTDYKPNIAEQLPATEVVSPIKLKRLTVQNIKCFKELEINFEENNSVLLGINGRGKTTLLQLLALAISATPRPMAQTYWHNVVRTAGKPANFSIEYTRKNKDLTLNFSIEENNTVKYNGNERNIAPLKEIVFAAYGVGRNAEPQKEALNENMETVATLFGINNLTNNKEVAADLLKQPDFFRELKSIITVIFNQAEKLANRVELVRYDKNSDTCYFKTPASQEVELPLSSLSDGFRTTFQWLLNLILQMKQKGFQLDAPQEIPGIVLIDGIEDNLQIKWQQTFLPTLSKLFKNMQFIVTTNSPFVVQSLENTNVIALQFDSQNENTVAVKSNLEPNTSLENIIEELFSEKENFIFETE